ncbi:ImmA/IrrE family metallo-endopeptidase [Alkalicoccobacillus murimartini]|uniref:Zn-dependent peptidase ImmA (M78 family) n=1 Tax=Alkalicoccobacillus murimartini TaxID=171685 RepID=A0ABT9YFP0_9BACI|nr:ImmA/IrrE family metallo-endopeptidase [Alkalicoccobacillus murimartini]MDQ0206673.1 Zn-dependent peptidase ImmA (M78 family) [Alkalicoccobacillus murimartini]
MIWIKETVREVTEKYRTNDPFELAAHLNVIIMEWNLDDEINGFYHYERRNKYIFLNNSLNETFKRYTLAHELGHSILHPKFNAAKMKEHTLYSQEKIEIEADTFAVELLITDHFLKENKNRISTIKDAALENGVPLELAHLKKV